MENQRTFIKRHINGRLTKIIFYQDEKSPYLFYYFRHDKKTFRGSTGSVDQTNSEEFVQKLIYQIETGEYDRIRERKKKGLNPHCVKFSEVYNRFLDYKLKECRLGEKTKQTYKFISKYLLDFFGDDNIEDFDNYSKYNSYKEWRVKVNFEDTEDGKKLKFTNKFGDEIYRSPRSNIDTYCLTQVNRDIELLTQSLRWCQDNLGVLQNKHIRTYKPTIERRREEILEDDEYTKIKNHYREHNPYYLNIVRFLVHTCLRPSEMWELKWKDIRFKEDVMYVRNRKNPSKGKLKTTLDTSFPIVGVPKEILLELYNREGIDKSPDSFVFVDNSGKRITRIDKSFKNTLRKCGINKDLTLYCLRHQGITRLVKKGFPPPYIRQVVGHSVGSKTLEKYYLHLGHKDVVKKWKEVLGVKEEPK